MLSRHLLQHPLQTALSILGIALAVAVVLSIDLTNASAGRAFELAKESVLGRVTHQIIDGSAYIDEDLYRILRVEHGLRELTPIVSGTVRMGDNGLFQLIGIDPVTLLGKPAHQVPAFNRSSFDLLIRPDTAFVTESTARKLGLEIPATVAVMVNGTLHTLKITATLATGNALQEQSLQASFITDIAMAQEILGMQGFLTRIDLVLTDAQAEYLQSIIRQPLELVRATVRGNAMQQMTRAFRINLTALSLLALVIGAFLIYNTMTISVLKRRNVIATLRTLGLHRRELFGLILGEALVLALAGTVAGSVLGITLSQYLLKLTSRTLDDLYFLSQVQSLYLNAWSFSKAIALGLFATLVATLIPAWEAANIPPELARSRSRLETGTRLLHTPFIVTGVGLMVAAITLLLISNKSIVAGFTALFLIIIGFALVTPAVLAGLIKTANPLLTRLLGLMGSIAGRGVLSSLSRTQVAVTALMIAVSATISVSIMISSFRQSVEHWLQGYLRADIYVTQARDTPNSGIPADIITRIEHLAVVDFMYTGRWRRLWQDETITWLYVTGIHEQAFGAYRFNDTGQADRWRQFQGTDSVIVSEPYAYHHDIHKGDRIRLPAAGGDRLFDVLGVYRDYGSDQGVVTMHSNTYARHWRDPVVMSLIIYLQPTANADAIVAQLNQGILGTAGLQARSNRTLRRQSMDIFDRTFAITEVLRLLTIIIAMVGILGALMAIQLERSREFAVLRANGLTPRDLKKLILSESGLMGMAAGILSIPLGIVMALVLIYVINRRSFGWSMQVSMEPAYLFSALLLGLVAGVVAGVYPAWHMAATSPAMALRDE